MARISLLALSIMFFALLAHGGSDMITKRSSHDVATTMDRLEAALKEKGITVVARVDHAGAAQKVDLPLRPTQLLIFGNPKLGTPLMQSNQTVGVDLPLKVLAWQDAEGNTWVTYESPERIAERHAVTDRGEVIGKMSAVLDALTSAATGP